MTLATDVFARASSGTRPTPTTLTAILASGSTPGTASCAALTGWPTTTKVHFCIYTINTSGAKVAGSQTDWVGVVSGTTITGLVLKAGTNTGYSVGAVVEASPIAAYADDLYVGLSKEHNVTDGSHGNITATGLAIASGTVSLPSASLNQTTLPLGSLAQIPQETDYSAVATGSTVIPFDDTIPQITEGDEYMTQTITPKSVSNTLVIEANIHASHSASGEMTAAIFQDSNANAIGVMSVFNGTATGRVNIRVKTKITAGTTSATTFRVRIGSESAGTLTFNGVGGARRFGAITKSSISVSEYKS